MRPNLNHFGHEQLNLLRFGCCFGCFYYWRGCGGMRLTVNCSGIDDAAHQGQRDEYARCEIGCCSSSFTHDKVSISYVVGGLNTGKVYRAHTLEIV